MGRRVSLHRALRNMAEFRSRPARELDAIADQMVCREYLAGDLICGPSTRIDFLGVVQEGEVVVELRNNGACVASTWLVPGDCVRPLDLTRNRTVSSVVVRATGRVRLYILNRKRLAALGSKGFQREAAGNRSGRWRWSRLWVVTVITLILCLSWNDLRGLVSDGLTLVVERTEISPGDRQGALAMLGFAEWVDRDAPAAYNCEGYVWFLQGDPQRAGASFAHALGSNPANGPALNNLAVTRFSTGQIQEGLPLQQKAVQEDPNNATLRYNLGMVLLRQGRNAEAVNEFREAARIAPGWVLPYLQQGVIFIQRQDYGEAEQAARTVIGMDPSQQAAHLTLAIALYNQGKMDAALLSAEAALKIRPTDHVAMFYEALALDRLGEPVKAAALLWQMLAMADTPQQLTRIEVEFEAVNWALQPHQAGAQ